VPEPGGHNYALDLVEQINGMNKGKYIDEEMKDAEPTNFCMGIAGYPEKHFEAPNMYSDLKYLKAKVDAGAEYIVTQMFFDNKKYFEFVKNCRDAGITVPIIPGIKMITQKKQLNALPKIFHIDMPIDLYKEIEKCKDDAQVKEVGINWAIQQCKELVKQKAPCVHFYTMGTSETTRRVASEVF